MPGTSRLSILLARRVALAIVIVIALVMAASWVAWDYEKRARQQQDAETHRSATREHLDEILRGWQRDTETLATSITFQRMLEPPGEARWTRLRAYLAGLGETLGHSGLMVLDGRGVVMFGLGQEAGDFPRDARFAREGDWFYSTDHDAFHHIQRAPLWLGLQGGHGQLIMLRALDNSVMRQLSTPLTRVHFTVGGRVLASSLGNPSIGNQLSHREGLTHLSHAGNPCTDIPLQNPSMRLHVELVGGARISPWLFASAGVLTALLLLAVLNFSVGAWMRATLARVGALRNASDRFAAHQEIDAEIQTQLDRADTADDEVGALSRALRHLMREARARGEESRAYLKTLDLLEEAVVELDHDLRIERASPALTRLVGGQHAGQRLPDCLHPEDRELAEMHLGELFHGISAMANLRLRTSRDGKAETWVEGRFVPVDQPVTMVRGVLRDITQTYLQEKHITHLALHDALTGLPNRVLLEDRCEIALRQAVRLEHGVGLGFIDLDHFKQINDSLGHKTGDKVLIAFARRVREALRGGDTLSRWGGDEFVVLLPDMPDLATLREVAAKIAGVCREPLRIDAGEYAITFSMGFAVYPDDAENIDTLLSQADRAMFHAKSQGRNNVQFFSDMGKKNHGKKDLYIQNKLAQAIREQRIQTWFQPVVAMPGRGVVAVEALARWHDPELGWVSPATFIPMAENLGLVRELGEQVWLEALTRLARWKPRGLRMAVNVSNRQLFMPYLTEKLVEDIRRHGLEAGDVTLEVTESVALLDVEYAAERLKELDEAGFHIAVDDFGTGYSSLSQLHEMPVDELKIDIAFVRRIHEPTGRRLIQAIVQMADALHLGCVAEGVEDEATAVALEQIGVRRMQGYLFAKPMPAEEVEAMLAGDAENR